MEKLILSLPEELSAPAESLSFSGTYVLPTLALGADTYSFGEPLLWNVVVSNTGGALLVSGLVRGEARTDCARCLGPALYLLEGEIEGYILLPDSDTELTEEELDESIVMSADFTADITSFVIAALSLELPQIPLCGHDCKGLCAGCGANLNHESCACDKTQEEDDDFSGNPFSILKKITFDE